LFKAGVLKEGYTCYPSVEEQIDVDGYQEENNVVETHNIMTSRGPATAICFGLAIVKKLVSDEMSESLRGGLLAQSCCQ
jgi:4-methyl-5(b-hydroxyethyl)-thiazole monophosphate biosynthesis